MSLGLMVVLLVPKELQEQLGLQGPKEQQGLKEFRELQEPPVFLQGLQELYFIIQPLVGLQ